MEISNYMDFQFLIRFLEGLQKFLGDNCEIIVHDYRKGYDHTIVYAFNSQLSGRDVGGSPRGGMITQLGNDIEPLKHSIISLDTSQKDRLFKSCTTLIEDEHHKIIGSVCLNMDVRDLYLAQSALQNLIGRQAPSAYRQLWAHRSTACLAAHHPEWLLMAPFQELAARTARMAQIRQPCLTATLFSKRMSMIFYSTIFIRQSP